MSERPEDLPARRQSPVGDPVIRGDPSVTGRDEDAAVAFDPDDPESLDLAAETVQSFAGGDPGDDTVYMLRGAAACAALVRGEGSYTAAAERAGDDVSISFVRKWARVHDLPRAIRRHVASGDIAPTAAKHVARVGGTDRLLLAWALLDHDLTVREVRSIAGEITDGTPVGEALTDAGVDLGRMDLSLPVELYSRLRRRAALEDSSPRAVVATALGEYFERHPTETP
ncbi:DUF7119 family protein [Halococcoides cellulosivorans]|uniref:DUF7119 domain-containing protein n=1 Tax=Halococcoides cellulosivorans TaxID=1679096 RepID=A0A2R4X433_9EURY|nr:hypothetical protein [Halococcoides cellulosivorans]AWB28561.1 hypothetical protein HARCEL1_13160 [Halococcoides cellulosivorans]